MTNNPKNSDGNLYVASALAILFVLIAAAAVWVTQIRPSSPDDVVEADALPAEVAPTETEALLVEEEVVLAEEEVPSTEIEATHTESEVAEAAPEADVPAGQSGSTVDLEAVIAAINKGGCTACHTISDIPGAVGLVGPDLSNIGVDGANRREGYTAEAYIRESLQDPLAFTAPECPFGPCVAGTMPPLQLEEAEIETLVGYLATLGTGSEDSR